MGSFGGSKSKSRSSSVTFLPEPSEEEKAVTRNLVDALDLELQSIRQQVDLQRELFDRFPSLFSGVQDSIDPLRLTPQQEAQVDESFKSALSLGEAEIARFRDEGLRNVRDVLAPSRGLRTTDTPILNAASDIVREGQLQQGQLVRGLSTAALDYKAQLAQQAFQNRLGLATGQAQSTAGLGLRPTSGSISASLAVLQNPRLAQTTQINKNKNAGINGGFTLSYGGTSGNGAVGGYNPGWA